MYSMLKKLITEKDIFRQVSLLEQLLNHSEQTTTELAHHLQTTERTIFSDLQAIRDQLPMGWEIETSRQGIQLIKEGQKLSNELWDVFLPQSVSIQLIKALFFSAELSTPTFLQENGVSYETLKRHAVKINRYLNTYQLQIKLTPKTAQLIGNESVIRIFFHRLLTSFTHNNYFFEDYSIPEEHYFHYLFKLNQSNLSVETEQIFGVCWFFINTIRIKSNCRINDFAFNKNDFLYRLYQEPLATLYEKEGIYLREEEHFFAFFCFLESWNYNNSYDSKLALSANYPLLAIAANQLTEQISKQSKVDLKESGLSENLLLLLLKYHESALLSEQFQLEYQELLTERKLNNRYQKDEDILSLIEPIIQLKDPAYLINLISLLEHQTLFALQPHVMTVFFLFQGEPAWKSFLQQELIDLLGRRVRVTAIELSQINENFFASEDIIVSNFPIEFPPAPIYYISSMPTKNELRQLTELTLTHYL